MSNTNLNQMKQEFLQRKFQLFDLFGDTVLFSDERIDESLVPPGLNVYYLRETDGGSGDPGSVEEFVLLNFYGIVLSKKKIELKSIGGSKPWRPIESLDDWGFLDEEVTVEEYLAVNYEE